MPDEKLFSCFQQAASKLTETANEGGWNVQIYAVKYPVTFVFRKDYAPDDDPD